MSRLVLTYLSSAFLLHLLHCELNYNKTPFVHCLFVLSLSLHSISMYIFEHLILCFYLSLSTYLSSTQVLKNLFRLFLHFVFSLSAFEHYVAEYWNNSLILTYWFFHLAVPTPAYSILFCNILPYYVLLYSIPASYIYRITVQLVSIEIRIF